MGSDRPTATRPPVKKIWGICMMREMEAKGYKEDEAKIKGQIVQFPEFFTIQRKYCEIFDTTQKIKKENTMYLRHIHVKCSDPNCTFHAIKHV